MKNSKYGFEKLFLCYESNKAEGPNEVGLRDVFIFVFASSVLWWADISQQCLLAARNSLCPACLVSYIPVLILWTMGSREN